MQIECKVSEDARASSILTNIAEIQEDGIDDRDSQPGNNDYTQNDYNSTGYTGNNENKEDLTDDNYFYQGREDDDDFEKIEVEGKTFDLIFLDPPYRLNIVNELLEYLDEHKMMKEGTIIVCHYVKGNAKIDPNFKLLKNYARGSAEVAIYEKE